MKSTRSVPGRSLVYSYRSLVHLLRTARIARAICCAHSFACLLTPELMERRLLSINQMRQFHTNSAHCGLRSSYPKISPKISQAWSREQRLAWQSKTSLTGFIPRTNCKYLSSNCVIMMKCFYSNTLSGF